MNKTFDAAHPPLYPSLGVVVPAYNEQDTITQCLEALYAQRDDIHEVVVVDNDSTDETAHMVEAMVSKWPSIRLLHEKQPGVVSARNTGFRAVNVDIIARIDADTVVASGWAAAYRRFFADASHANIGASTGLAVPYDLPFPRLAEAAYKIFILQSNRLVTSDDTLFGTNMALRRVAWQAIKNEVCRKHDIMEDMDVGLHLRRHGYRVKATHDAMVTFSARRMLTSPASYFKYATMWPLTYWHHGMKMTTLLTWPFMLAGCLLQLLLWPILRSYDPARRRFSVRRLFSEQPTRMIPKGS